MKYSEVEYSSPSGLLAEQALVQAEKFQGRQLAEYNDYMFLGQSWREPRGSAVTDLVRPLIADGEKVTLQGALQGLREKSPDDQVSWVDMGGGRALAMRQVNNSGDTEGWLQTTSVDLFDYGLNGIKPEEIDYLEELSPGITKESTVPNVLLENVETVQLPKPANLITSVEVIQYLNDPLAALVNWYNQLADSGIMLVAAEHDWASWIRYSSNHATFGADESPTQDFVDILTKNDITFAASDEPDARWGRSKFHADRFRVMGIQKKPETSLRLNQTVGEIWTSPSKYKAAYYEKPTEQQSLIEVVNSPAKNLGKVTMNSLDR